MRIDHLFTVPLAQFSSDAPGEFWVQLSELLVDRANQGDRYGETGPDGATFESNSDLFHWDHPLIPRMAAFAHMSMAQTIRAVSDHSEEEFQSLVFDYQSWCHVSRHGGYQPFHIQPNGSWTGLLFVDLGDEMPDRPESGAIMLHDSRVNACYLQDEGSIRLKHPATFCAHQLLPERGNLYIFPSYIQQECFAYLGERPRILVYFNCWVRMEEHRTVLARERARLRVINAPGN